LFLDLPVFVCGSIVMMYFYRQSDQINQRGLWTTLVRVPLAMLVGVGLSFCNSIAVAEGWLGAFSGFVRTPKMGDATTSKPAIDKRKSLLGGIELKEVVIAAVEIIIAVNLLYTAMDAYNLAMWLTIPFGLRVPLRGYFIYSANSQGLCTNKGNIKLMVIKGFLCASKADAFLQKTACTALVQQTACF
jgi:hypothetical protein